MLITSISNDKVKSWNKLKQKKYRDENREFLIEGLHLVLEAYKTGNIKELILEQDELVPLDVPTTYVTKEIINKISLLKSPSNVMAVCKMPDYNSELGAKILMLDGIQDPGNLGTIIRSAVAFGIDTIVLGENTVDCYNEKVIRGSQGMIFYINIINKNIKELIPNLKDNNIKVFGTKVTHGKNLKETNITDNFAIIMGNEGSGVSEEILDLCDEYIYINMSQVCESLNVGVATSIILYQFSK
ncbi:MAG: RNA methyltransferase [Bacilli bacterium]|nr:RNA methyltransferase [Bacilli bacterium]